VSNGVLVAFQSEVAPRYEQCDFLGKALEWYQRFNAGTVSFEEWLQHRRHEVSRDYQLLDADFAVKLKSAGVIQARIIDLAKDRGGKIELDALKADPVLQELIANRYKAYLPDRMARLVRQGVFLRIRKGVYQLCVGCA